MRSIAVSAMAAALLGLSAGCGNPLAPTTAGDSAADAGGPTASVSAPGADGGSQDQPGSYTTGSATITAPAGQATLAFSEGLYVSANGSVVANFADGATSDPATNALGLSGVPGGLTATLIGPLQPQGVTTECTVSASQFEPTGFVGTFQCAGDISGTFEAH